MSAFSIGHLFEAGSSDLLRDHYDDFKENFKALGVEVRNISDDSRLIKSGDLFFAYPGFKQDGRIHIADAVKRGCSGVVWEVDGWLWNSDHTVPNIGVRNARSLMGKFAADFYDDPTSNQTVFAVTGTNGKTTCVNWIAESLHALGQNSASIGTLGLKISGQKSTVNFNIVEQTTPDAITLQRIFRELNDIDVNHLAIEASSHALSQNRLDGTKVNIALFTNLTQEHTDYHGSLESYGLAKARLFVLDTLSHSVINIDDKFGADLAAVLKRYNKRIVTYSVNNTKATVYARSIKSTSYGSKFTVDSPWGSRSIEVQVIGGFNISNLLAVVSGLVCSGISFEKACGAISGLTHPQGRLQKVRSLFRRSVYVDYAHTPDALKSVLATLKGLVQFDGRLITVFGAGGDRDKNKRPMMGNVVLDYSDIAIVTSDNPRYENPLEISEAIVVGNKNRFMIDLDRRSAIRRAIDLSGEADIVLIAGKGHEKYQEVAGKRFSFDDYLEAESYLNDMYSGSIRHEGCLNV